VTTIAGLTITRSSFQEPDCYEHFSQSLRNTDLCRPSLVVLRRKSPKRVRLWNLNRLMMAWLYRLYPSLLDAIIIVQPETVIRWHRRGFRA